MKNLLMLVGMLTGCIYNYAQNRQLNIDSVIRNLEEKERIAILDSDTVTLKKLWAVKFTVNTPFNRVTTSSRELLDMVNNGTIRFSSFERNIQQIIIRKDVAITFGSEEVVFVIPTRKEKEKISRRFTNIWFKQDGIWKLTARHANNICKN